MTNEQTSKDRTLRLYNLHLADEGDCDENGMPMMERAEIGGEGLRLASFKAREPKGAGAHFFMEDYAFECTWREPERYVPMLSRFAYTLTPDFSCFLDMPSPMQRWNVYRSRALGLIWQRAGLVVVPTVTWGLPDTFDFAFDGIPDGSAVAFSSVGLMRCEEGRRVFREGAEAACEYLRPSLAICYGVPCGFDSNGAEVAWMESEMQKRFDEIGKEG